MAEVHLRPVTLANFEACIGLEVMEEQRGLVAPNVKSLAEAAVNSTLTPLAIYDAAVAGHVEPPLPMVGFTLLEVTGGVGFILRLMIDQRFQGQGYGRAAMVEAIRRLRLLPEVELIATSHRHTNVTAAQLYRGLGFVAWEIEWARGHPTDTFLRLPAPATSLIASK